MAQLHIYVNPKVESYTVAESSEDAAAVWLELCDIQTKTDEWKQLPDDLVLTLFSQTRSCEEWAKVGRGPLCYDSIN